MRRLIIDAKSKARSKGNGNRIKWREKSGKEEERNEIERNEICFKNKVLLGTSVFLCFFPLKKK